MLKRAVEGLERDLIDRQASLEAELELLTDRLGAAVCIRPMDARRSQRKSLTDSSV